MKKSTGFFSVILSVVLAAGLPASAAAAEGAPEVRTDLQQGRITVKGVVCDAEGVTVPGAYIIEKGNQSNGTVSDNDGKFTLSVAEGATLEISCMGYATTTVAAAAEVKVRLDSDTEFLDEVVVVGYGQQRVATITGSVSQVKNDKLVVAPITNATHALAGQLPGLVSKQMSGLPGQDDASLRIRGADGAPLVIIDGIEGSLSQVDPAQIESISILKDGAASIYGARAGNGVILVTTKRGSNQKPVVQFNGSVTMQGAIVTTLPANSAQRAKYQNASAIASGGRAKFTEEDIAHYEAGDDPAYLNTDWWSACVREFAPQQNHSISLTGGTEKIQYYGYLGYNDQETMFRTNGGGYNRYNFQTNFVSKITDNLEAGMDIQYIRSYRKYAHGANMQADSSNFWRDLIYKASPFYPLSFPDGSYDSYADCTYGNPVWATDFEKSGYWSNRQGVVKLNGYLKYDFKYLKGLSAKANVLFTGSDAYSKTVVNQGSFYTYNDRTNKYSFSRKSQDPTKIDMNYGFSQNLVQQYSLSYNRDFNGHNVSAMGMYEYTLLNNIGFSAGRGDFSSLIIEELFAGSDESKSNNSWSSNYGRISWIGRLNYNYKDKYMVEGIFRADASSRFSEATRWGYFPSISAGWNIAREDFVKDITDKVDTFKIRASYGTSGYDSVADFNFLTGYSYDYPYTINGTLVNGLISSGLANEKLTWELMKIYNVGLDYSFFDRKLYGEAEVFQRDRIGIPGVRSTSLPSTFGAEMPQENLNNQRTRGFEFRIGSMGSIGELKYDISANIAYNNTIWTYFDEAEYADPDDIFLKKQTGHAVDRQVGYVSDGLFASQEEIDSYPYVYEGLGGTLQGVKPGDVKYVDQNGDNVINWRDQVEIGKGIFPHWTTGLNLAFAWKGIDLSMLLQGGWAYSTSVRYDDYTALYAENYFDEKYNPDPQALMFRAGGVTTNWLTSTYFIHDSAYLRLRNAAIGYTLPEKLVNKVGIEKLRIYVGGTNLFTLSNLNKYGVDAELNQGHSAGIGYPQQYTLSAGINLVL